MQTELDTLANQTIQRLAENIQLPLWELDERWVEKVIATEMLHDAVFAVRVESEGQLFAGKIRDDNWQLVNMTEAVAGDFLKREIEVSRKGERIGFVTLYMTRQFLEQEMLSLIYFVIFNALILGLLLIASLHVLLNRIVILPLQNMLAVVNDIADGNYKRIIRRIDQNDEIGELAFAMQRMTESLRQAAEAAAAVAEGDYTHRVEVRGPDDLFALSMNKMTDSLNDVVKQIDVISLGNYQTHLVPRSEHDTLGIATQRMTLALESFNQQHQQQIWLQQSIVELADVLRNENTIDELAHQVIQVMCRTMDAKVGALFLIKEVQNEPLLYIAGRYAYYFIRQGDAVQFRMGEGLVGQVAQEQKSIMLQNISEGDIKIQSGIGSFTPQTVMINPFSFKHEIRGIIELGFNSAISEIQQDFLNRTQEAIASAFESIYVKDRLSGALRQSQVFSEELQVTNEELLIKTKELEKQALELQESERISFERAKDLEESSRYKSEFLANMSHELRTPLNSLLILAKLLSDNEQGTLTQDQVESAQVIQTSGQHLLQLINEILDLSRAEAGHIKLKPSHVSFSQLVQLLQQRFDPLVNEKKVQFNILLAERLPDYFISDKQKLEQILTNLLGNAIKFTHQGSVSLSIDLVTDLPIDLSRNNAKIDSPEQWIRFAVQDTGAGIPEAELKKIFLTFHQVDGSFSRRYGGTGLGLSIALAYAVSLGGRIDVDSKASEGSTFSLFLPLHLPDNIQMLERELSTENTQNNTSELIDIPISAPPFADDRYNIHSNDVVILVLEDDPEFARILYQQCKAQSFKCIVSSDAESTLQLAKRYSVSGIILDLCLPGMDGKEFLQRLKTTQAIRHIPVHIISVMDDDGGQWQEGIVGYLTKPVTQQQINEALQRLKHFERGNHRRLLIIEQDLEQQQSLSKLLESELTDIELSRTIEDVMVAIREKVFDCIIMDIELLDNKGLNLLQQLEQDENLNMPPIIVYTDREISEEEQTALKSHSNSIVINSKLAPERLKDEVALFLHLIGQKKEGAVTSSSVEIDDFVSDKSLMIVDDDMRNSYALAKALRHTGMGVTIASNGQDALTQLSENKPVDIILMDIMMPEMDGFETIKKIRQQEKFENLPIIVVTARSMSDDKEHCIELGANDYLAKPIDVNQLITMIRTWIKS